MERSPFQDGNRFALPQGIAGSHFFYRTESAAFAPEDVNCVVSVVQRLVRLNGLHPAQIEVFGKRDLEGFPEAAAAFDRLASQWGLQDWVERPSVSLVVCEWAAPHADTSWNGEAFVSHVLHTGPQPYLMQTFHSYVNGSTHDTAWQDVTTSTRVLKVGDSFVLDPTTPHMAAPLRPGPDQLLVLLQAVVPDMNEQDRSQLLKNKPPRRDDVDDHLAFAHST